MENSREFFNEKRGQRSSVTDCYDSAEFSRYSPDRVPDKTATGSGLAKFKQEKPGGSMRTSIDLTGPNLAY